MSALTDELRRRLDVPVDLVPDARLDQALLVAGNLVEPWRGVHVEPDPFQANVDEATVQLAVKLWDVAARGATSMDAMGEFLAPAPAATPGLIRSIFGALGPAMNTGGVSV